MLLALVFSLIALAGTPQAERPGRGPRSGTRSQLQRPRHPCLGAGGARSAHGNVGLSRTRRRRAQIVGRVIAVDVGAANQTELSIRLVASRSSESNLGGTIQGAPASLDLRDAMRLLINPGTPADEATLRATRSGPVCKPIYCPGSSMD